MEVVLAVTYALVGTLIIVYDCFLPNTAVWFDYTVVRPNA